IRDLIVTGVQTCALPILTGTIIVGIGSMLAGVGTIFNPLTIVGLVIMIVLTSLALNTMMFLLMVRIEDPLVPRAMFGILNTLLRSEERRVGKECRSWMLV